MHRILPDSPYVVISFPGALRRQKCGDVLDTKAPPSDTHSSLTGTQFHCIATSGTAMRHLIFKTSPSTARSNPSWITYSCLPQIELKASLILKVSWHIEEELRSHVPCKKKTIAVAGRKNTQSCTYLHEHPEICETTGGKTTGSISQLSKTNLCISKTNSLCYSYYGCKVTIGAFSFWPHLEKYQNPLVSKVYYLELYFNSEASKTV